MATLACFCRLLPHWAVLASGGRLEWELGQQGRACDVMHSQLMLAGTELLQWHMPVPALCMQDPAQVCYSQTHCTAAACASGALEVSDGSGHNAPDGWDWEAMKLKLAWLEVG